MKWPAFQLLVAGFLLSTPEPCSGGLADSLREKLSYNTPEGGFRFQLGGLTDLEYYVLPEVSPGLIFTDQRQLFNPRFTLFADAQLGDKWYAFAQVRVDRGFDPSDNGIQARLDEIALRLTPWEDGRLNIQVGQFASVIGSRQNRHLSWENPFINAPLSYENLTAIWYAALPDSKSEFLGWGRIPTAAQSDFGNGFVDKHIRLPTMWGPAYTTGASVAGKLGAFEYAAEIKNVGPGSRPTEWAPHEGSFEHPTYAGRLGFRPSARWNFGVSYSNGPFLVPDLARALPSGTNIGDFRQKLVALDASFEWHHLQIWSEIFHSRYNLANGIEDVHTTSYYVEAKYKFTPQFYGALRWNQQLYSNIDFEGQSLPWSREIWRLDTAVGYRFTPNTQMKLQHGIQQEEFSDEEFEHLFGVQLTTKF